MKKCVNGQYFDMTEEEILELQSKQEIFSNMNYQSPEDRMTEIENALIELAAMFSKE